MPSTLYALLIGIDAYNTPPLRPLQGCGNDIDAIHHYLQQRTGKDGYHPLVLKNADATRQAVIDGLQHHLTQAGPEDVALFYFSGHGSQQDSDPAFWPIEPDHLDETLVCWDSRQPDHYDLADKTLAILLAQVAARGAHAVVVLDCCHSGSGTRDAEAERRAPIDHRPRPFESYLCTPAQITRSTTISNWLTLPEGRHILLAACRADETAKECATPAGRRGVFSYHLSRALAEARTSCTYRDLFKRAQALVRSQHPAQSPQLEATAAADLDLPFLGGALQAHSPHFTVYYDADYASWMLDGGALHGLLPTVQLALFAFAASPADLQQMALAKGTAEVTKVEPQASYVTLSDVAATDRQQSYKALITYLPLPPVGVRLEGEAEGLALVRQALSAPGPDAPALYVQAVETDARLRLLAHAGRYTLTNAQETRPLVADISGYTPNNAAQAARQLAHIARWLKTLELHQPGGRLPANALEITLTYQGQLVTTPNIVLDYHFVNGKWQQPDYVITLTNRADTTLYCALLGLWESYAIESLLNARVVRLKPGEAFQQKLYASVPEPLWKAGITERRDVLKVIACSAEFDPTLLEQGPLAAPRSIQRKAFAPSALNRLFNRVQTRESGADPDTEFGEDWTTAMLTYTVRRPLSTALLTPTGPAAHLGAGVTVAPHPQLRANLRLTALPQTTRTSDMPLLPAILREADPATTQPFYFSASRNADPGLNVLELSDIVDPTVVTPAAPLQLTLNTALPAHEHLLPLAFDGEFFWPLGYARSVNGQTQVTLTRLPTPHAAGTRDPRSTVQILLQKFIGQTFGAPYAYPLLRGVTVSPSGVVTYEDNANVLKARIAQAQQVTLYVHGLTGDSLGMVTSARHYAKNEVLLAFDYESFNTPVEETAHDLKKRLTALGLGPGHSKTLRVIAHSLGGLVTRYLIEREGGASMVQHLIACGTPHSGSPIATAQDWATIGLGIAINNLALTAWPVLALNAFLVAFEKLDVTLDQVKPNSELLKTLAASDDPHVPYTLIAGHTALAPAALQPDPASNESRLGRFLTRLGYAGANLLLFFGQPNDIAVSVPSAKAVDSTRTPSPKTLEIGCDHLMFFDSEAGLAALGRVL